MHVHVVFRMYMHACVLTRMHMCNAYKHTSAHVTITIKFVDVMIDELVASRSLRARTRPPAAVSKETKPPVISSSGLYVDVLLLLPLDWCFKRTRGSQASDTRRMRRWVEKTKLI